MVRELDKLVASMAALTGFVGSGPLLPLVPVPLLPELLPLLPELPPLDCANNDDVRKPAIQIASCAIYMTLFMIYGDIRDKGMRRACAKRRIGGSGRLGVE